MKYFKSEETNDLFRFWISNFPKSYHSLDMDRFYAFVFSLLSNDDYLKREMIEESAGKKLSQDDIDNYMNKYEIIAGFYQYMVKSNIL